ncbi:MAG: CHAP domain-containing protein [Patescibacteria group bacterium]
MSIPKAQAANSMEANLNIARGVVDSLSSDVFEPSTSDNVQISFVSEGYLPKPLVAETVVTKEEKVVVKTSTKVKTTQVNKVTSKIATIEAGESHSFPYGYCTYYVSQRRNIPWSGNAIAWLSGAQRFGFATGSTPQVGSIVVTTEGGKTGHVGMVDGVDGDQITITEMNYRGFGVISTRTISASYSRIMGYIY